LLHFNHPATSIIKATLDYWKLRFPTVPKAFKVRLTSI